tara:strand:+ start:1391 stop:1579 length:189 start_codon:yes stop_codon:yes gene_type:complete
MDEENKDICDIMNELYELLTRTREITGGKRAEDFLDKAYRELDKLVDSNLDIRGIDDETDWS